MTFEQIPILDTMYELYQQPANRDRFGQYIKLLQGSSRDDMELPIGGYNPMAKEHILQKIEELKKENAEQLISQTLTGLNNKLKNEHAGHRFKVVLNLSDDLKGGWTNRYTSDYSSKFKLNALVTRNFCTPVFWTSENYNQEMIIARTLEYCYRTFFWLAYPRPQTLKDHILLETLVAAQTGDIDTCPLDTPTLSDYFHTHSESSDYLVIFNFLYGDKAMESLGNTPKGIKDEFAGFRFAAWQAKNSAK